MGGALRFWELGAQSLWVDEALTASAVAGGLGGAVDSVLNGGIESNPPLYYMLVWAWKELFGDGEAALRSLSALAGTATIVLCGVLGRQIAGARGGIAAAVVVATSPMLLWYSQEARTYSLFTAFAVASVVAAIAADRTPSARRSATWAALAAATVLTHYYGAFLVLIELALLWRSGRVARGWALAAGGAILVAAAMAVGQLDTTAWLEGSPLVGRTQSLVAMLLTSTPPSASPAGTALPALAFIAGLAVIALCRRRVERPVWLLAAVAIALIVLPYAAVVVGVDAITPRNFLAPYVLLLVVFGAGLAAARGRAAVAAGGVLAAVVAVNAVSVLAIYSGDVQPRDDWRSAMREVPRSCGTQALILPENQGAAARYYAPEFRRVPAPPERVDHVHLLRILRSERVDPPPPQPGFAAQEPLRSAAADHFSLRARSGGATVDTEALREWIGRQQDDRVDVLVRSDGPPCDA